MCTPCSIPLTIDASKLPGPPADVVPWQSCPTCDGSLSGDAFRWEVKQHPGQTLGLYTQACRHCGAGYVARYRLVGGNWRWIKAELVEPGRRNVA